MSTPQGKNDPANYRKLAEPFPDSESANGAINAFWEELYELRNKHRLANLHVTISVNVAYPEGEVPVMVTLHMGDALQALPMAAWAFGHEKASHEDVITAALAQSLRAGRKRKGD